MSKLSFFKGVLIASVFSIAFWVGVAYVITDSGNELPQEEIQKEDTEENTYAAL